MAAALLFSCALSLNVRMQAVDRGFAIVADEGAGGCAGAPSVVDDEDISSSGSGANESSQKNDRQLLRVHCSLLFGEHLFYGRGQGASHGMTMTLLRPLPTATHAHIRDPPLSVLLF